MTQLAPRQSRFFKQLEPGDRVMVAVSGGKDSHALLYLLREIQRRAPFEFSLVAVNVDQGHPGFPKATLPDFFKREGYEFEIVEEDTYSVVKEKVPAGKTTCSLCSRLRRGILYTTASRLGATKIALGHHRDDVIETLLLNLFFSGQTKAMPPRLLLRDDGKRQRRDSPARVRGGGRHRDFCGRRRRSRSFPATCAARKSSCSESA